MKARPGRLSVVFPATTTSLDVSTNADKIVQPPSTSGGQEDSSLMNNAQTTSQSHHHFVGASIAPFVEAAAQYSGVFYDNLSSANLTVTPSNSASLLASNAEPYKAVIRLVQMNRAGDKRTDSLNGDVDEDALRRRKIRRTQSHMMSDSMIDKRPQSVIIGPGGNNAGGAVQTIGRLFLGSSPTECNKNFVFSEDSTSAIQHNENDSSDGAKSQTALNGWQIGPSTSTNPAFGSLSHNVVGLLQNGQTLTATSKPTNSTTTLTLPNSIIQLSNLNSDPFSPVDHRSFGHSNQSDPQHQQPRFNTNAGQFAFQNLFLNGDTPHTDIKQQLNGTYSSSASGQENQLESGIHQNGYSLLTSHSKRTRRFSHHGNNEQSTNSSNTPGHLPHHNRHHKHLPRAPTLQQIGRNLIEFARSSTPRIQRRIQSAKSHLQQNDNHPPTATNQRLSTSANNSPVHLVYSSTSPSRRSTHHHHHHRQSSANHSSATTQQPGEQISCAHPDYHIGAFLDGAMRPTKLDALLDLPEPTQKQMEQNAWNPDDRSLNIYVKEEDRLTLHRHPVAQSTDCIRGRVGYSKGFHVWQIVWPLRQRGTHAVIGVASKDAPLHAPGYSSLVGSTTDSYGWDLIRNVCLHDAKNTKSWAYPNPELVGERFNAPEKIYCILDMDEGTMAFATEHAYLGVAFRNLRGQTLHPIVCAVWGHVEIQMRYLGTLEPEPRLLMDLCRRTIRLQLGPQHINRVDELPLPKPLKNYIQYRPIYEQ